MQISLAHNNLGVGILIITASFRPRKSNLKKHTKMIGIKRSHIFTELHTLGYKVETYHRASNTQ